MRAPIWRRHTITTRPRLTSTRHERALAAMRRRADGGDANGLPAEIWAIRGARAPAARGCARAASAGCGAVARSVLWRLVWNLAAAIAFTSAYMGAFAVAGRVRRRPAGLVAPLAVALLVCFESLLVHALSPFHAVARGPLLAGNLVFAAAALAALRARSVIAAVRAVFRGVRTEPLASAALALLFAPVCWSAALYRPNNWDSMTYHLARVAYWVQDGSVAAYPTGIVRQVAAPPGGEYLLLVLQAIARSDALANLVQLGAWVLLACAAPPLARAFGAPRTAARWAGIVTVAAPMAMLQGSSTQNDLLGTVLTIAILAAALPLLHGARWRAGDLALVVVAITAGVVVKPTSVVVAAPFLAWGAVRAFAGLRRGAWRRALTAAPALLVAVGTLGPPAAARAAAPGHEDPFAPFVYGAADAPLDRLANSARGLARHVPVPEAVERRLALADGFVGCGPGAGLCVGSVRRMHEDYAGNPGQALLVLVALVLAAARWRVIPPRSRAALIALVASWILFHAIFRYNPWLARLQLPLFGLAGLAFVALPRGWTRSRPATIAVAAVALALAADGARAAVEDESRPVRLEARLLEQAHAPAAYYFSSGDALYRIHGATLAILEASGCRRLGLVIGGDSYDYPLAWRAMDNGVEVRHLVGETAARWDPCAVFVEDASPPPGEPGRWIQSTVPFVWFSASFVSTGR
jgi:hypothetical protein